MFDHFDHFDQAFQSTGPSQPLRRRKTFRQWGAFFLGNLLLIPILLVTHASVAGEGIRGSLPVFQRKLWSLPIPGASFARSYDGFDKLDLSFLAAVTLFAVAALVWKNLFLMLHEVEGRRTREQPPISWMVRLAIFVSIIGADAALFWAGLASQSAGGWSETPAYVAPLATALFTALIAAVAAWHADFHTSRYA